MSVSHSPRGLEWLCRYTATLQAPEVIGPVPEGCVSVGSVDFKKLAVTYDVYAVN